MYTKFNIEVLNNSRLHLAFKMKFSLIIFYGSAMSLNYLAQLFEGWLALTQALNFNLVFFFSFVQKNFPG